MKNAVKFLFFIIYSTCIFFLPNTKYLIAFALFNIFIVIINKLNFKKIIRKTLNILPFVLFTFIVNCFLDTFYNALWIGLKLILVCNITIIYSETTSVVEIAQTIKDLCFPLKFFGIDTEEIKLLVCIALSMIPILKKDLKEVKEVCLEKNIKLNIKNSKIIMSKYFLNLLFKVNELEDSLNAKGYESE